LLSNTNALRWGRDDIAGVLETLFSGTSRSFETGLLKSDSSSFEQVLRHFGSTSGEMLFLDDNPLSIKVAIAIGIRARLTRGMNGIRSVLAAQRISFEPMSY